MNSFREGQIQEAGAQQPYLRNAWYATAWSKDLTDAPLLKIILEEEIVLYRRKDGSPVALGNRCPHRFAELHGGKIIGDNLQCPYHGLQFGPSGNCAHNPHSEHRPAAAHVKSYPIAERHSLIWLWMGEPERALPDLIPDFSVLEDPGHSVVRGTLDLAADYQLYNDNLLDLSHSEFVHPALLEEGNLDRSVTKVEVKGATVHFIRDSEKEPATGTFQRLICEGMGGKAGDIVHTRHHIRWDAPSNLYAEITQFWQDKKSVFTNVHVATPTRRGACQLLWSAARTFRIDDAKLDEFVFVGMSGVLGKEDAPPMESQQTYIGNRDLLSLKPILLPTDVAPVKARRILARLIEEEGARPGSSTPRSTVLSGHSTQ
jgi:phenylpropionate dioxygenase-like ring-hydroxylating dioxygenase large terminal subunit